MSPNPMAQRIAQDTGRPYDEIRRALNRLEEGGRVPFDAERVVRQLAAHATKTGDVEEGARVIVLLGLTDVEVIA